MRALKEPSSYLKKIDGLSLKLMDLNKLGDTIRAYRKRNEFGMNVTVRVVKQKQNRNLTTSVSHAYIRESDLYVGIVTSVRQDGNCTFKRYFVEEGEILMLDKQQDMNKYILFMLSSCFLCNPFMSSQLNGPQYYYIEDPNEVAASVNKKSMSLVDALNRIEKMSGVQLLNNCRYFNLISNEEKPIIEIMRAKLQSKAIENPIEFMSKLNSKGRGIMTLVESALLTNIFEFTGDEYIFDGKELGRNVQDIAITLSANSILARFVQERLLDVDEDMKKMAVYDNNSVKDTSMENITDILSEIGTKTDSSAPVKTNDVPAAPADKPAAVKPVKSKNTVAKKKEDSAELGQNSDEAEFEDIFDESETAMENSLSEEEAFSRQVDRSSAHSQSKVYADEDSEGNAEGNELGL